MSSSTASKSLTSRTLMLWGAVIALTLVRIAVSVSGALTPQEAFLSICASHPAGAYVEGSPGAPLLVALLDVLGGSGLVALRLLPVIATLLLSWGVWWIARRISPQRPAVALWSVLAVNLLPQVNVASMVMDGAMISGALLLLALVAGWHAVETKGDAYQGPWILFGTLLAVTTLFIQESGILLPAALLFRFTTHGMKSFPWRGALIALGLLIVGWIPSLVWNARHECLQWSSVAPGFDVIRLGGFSCRLGVLVFLSVIPIPFLVHLAHSGKTWKTALLLAFLPLALVSVLFLASPLTIPSFLPSPIGVRGMGVLSRETLGLRDSRVDAKGNKPFLIASTPGLAALLGERLRIDYPERPGAPSVFAAESPSLNSSYALWPSYPDAVGAGIKDPLYTEEKSTSPFLGRNALYITAESSSELPQTIKGAFAAVGLLKEIALTWNGRPVTIRIYQCEDYRTLSL